jgi:hypothetical protein
MIVYLTRKDVDLEKYDACIQNSINSRIYAFSWFLDIVADNWDLLVLDDYEAVMPLPWRMKYFIKYIYPPCWTQQLGVFSEEMVTEKLLEDFVNAIPKKFKKVSLQCNAENPILKKAAKKNNYILNLNRSVAEIYACFNKNRKRSLKNASEALLEKKVSPEDFLDFYKIHGNEAVFSKNHWKALKNLLDCKQHNLHIWGTREKGMLSAVMLWGKEGKRLTYLIPCATKSGKKKGMPSFLVFELIRAHANNNLWLDFEGSMIPGVARFYKSFGAEMEVYSFFQFHTCALLFGK